VTVSTTSTLDLGTLWAEGLAEVMRTVTSTAQRQWLVATHPVGFSEDTIILATPHSFAREWLDRNCGDTIRRALSGAAGRDLNVVITVQTNPAPVEGTDPAPSAADSPLDLPGSLPSDDLIRAPFDIPTSRPSRLRSTPATATIKDLDRRDDRLPRRVGDGSLRAVTDERLHPDLSPLHAPGRPDGPTVELPTRRARAWTTRWSPTPNSTRSTPSTTS
jgi:chromosomal replication initiator protein